MNDTTDRTFRFDQLDESGLLLGLGLLQLAVLGVGLFLSAVAISAGIPGPVAGIPVVVTAAVAFGRLHGRPLTEWLPVIVRWVASGRTRGRTWFAMLGMRRRSGRSRPIPLPPPLEGLRLIEADSPWHRMAKVGLVEDSVDDTLAALVPVRGRDFALLERADQEELLNRWGEALAAFARERGTVVRLGWSEFAAPVGLGEHRRWLAQLPNRGGRKHRQEEQDAIDSYDELIESARLMTSEHQVLVTITVARGRLRAAQRRRRRDDPLVEAAVGVTESLLRGLRNADVDPGTPLTVTEIATALRWRADPFAMRGRADHRQSTVELVDPTQAGPLATKTEWSTLRTDGAVHRTFWIAEWPRLPVHADWLEPLLAYSGTATRAITMIYEPVAPSTSRRRIDRESIKLESDATAKEEKGRRVNAQHRRNQLAVAEREQELVAGYVEFDYLGLLTVTASDDEELVEDCDRVDQLAREHGLELRPLDGRHDLAWATSLPVGLGVSRTVQR